MLSWASYLFGGSSPAEPQQDDSNADPAMETDVAQTDKDSSWVVVEHSECSFGRIPTAHRSHVTCYPGNMSHGDAGDSSGKSVNDSAHFSQTKCDSSSSSPSKHSTPGSLSPVSHSRHLYICTNDGRSSEAWLLTPPSCFTAGNNQVPKVGITDLENLLIEHPSMSVYKRSGSAGEDSSNSESSNELDSKSNRSQAMSRQAPKRVRAVSARAELIAQVCKVKHAQKLQQKRSCRGINKKSLDKANKVAINDKRSPRTSRARNPSGQMNGRVPQRKQ